MREVLPAQPMPPPALHRHGPIPQRFFERFQSVVPPAHIVELPHAQLIGPDGWIVGAKDSYLLDTSFWAYPDREMSLQDHYILIPKFRRSTRRLPGKTLSLASDFAIGGFGHFLHDSLTRLHLVERAGLDFKEFDWIYWPHLDTPAVRSLVESSGVPPEKILRWNRDHDFVCDSLTATTFPGRPGQIAPAYANFLRNRFAPATTTRTKKIYLSREGFRRNFRHAPMLEKVLRDFGYETCRAHEDPDTFKKCAAATHIVAIEGASFFNAFVCAPGTKVLLILPDAGPTLPYTITLSLAARFEVFLVAAESLDQPQIDPGIADIDLDPTTLAEVLAQME